MENFHLFLLWLFINLTIKQTIASFPFNKHILVFSLDCFSNCSVLNYFLHFFFAKSSNNSFAVRIVNNVSPRHSIFNFFNHKNFFRPIWSVTFRKKLFMFWYSNNITNFKFKISFIIFLIKSICVGFYIKFLEQNFLKLRSCIYQFYSLRF